MARAKFWRGERRFLATFPDLEETSPLLELDSEFAHAFVLVLSQLPIAARTAFAADFYARREPRAKANLDSDRARLASAAKVALLIAELGDGRELEEERLRDLLHGAAQGDDLVDTPETVFFDLRETVAKLRVDVARADPDDPRSAASTAVVETLDPSSGVVDLQEILVRSAWAAVRSWEPPRVLEFLLLVDQSISL